jgi:hypothetical protein
MSPNPFCRSNKRLKGQESSTSFDAASKKRLSDGDRGSYYNQAQQWPTEFVKEKERATEVGASDIKLF